MMIDETEIRKAILQLHDDSELFEIRIIGSKKAISGYFKDAETLIRELKLIDLRNVNVYITLNQIKDSLFSRAQSENFVAGAKNTTSDNEVIGYKWLFIDLDPQRETGISSSDDELQEAYDMARRISVYLSELGFEEPVKALSGNGAHLLYRVRLANTEENKELVQKCLNTLSVMFSNERVEVDTANFNPSRICKLYGTLAQKGKNTKNRPFRMSKIVGDVKECKVTDKAYLQKLVGVIPEEPPKPTKHYNYNASEFDIEEWMNRYGLTYRRAAYKDGIKYLLDECPFNPQHKAPDSMITKAANGAIGFVCLHNSCSCYKWRDVRIKFEPDAYDITDDERRITEGYLKHNREYVTELDKRKKIQVEGSEPMFLNAKMIYDLKCPDAEYIKTGISVIDKRMKGLQKGWITVVSGLRGAAKSTLLNQIILNCVDNKHTTVIYSGELNNKRLMSWLYLQAAGKANVLPYQLYEGYYCPKEKQELINDWLSDYVWVYNNHYGNDFEQISEYLKQEIEKVHADLCIIDNLMALDLSSYDTKDKYEAQTKFVWDLKNIAERCNVHIIFVAHPRKSFGFLRLDDISGTGNIGNIVDNAFIVHRNNNDFQRLSKQMFGWKDDNEAYSGTNVIEICKDREMGIQDCFIPLWFEVETKRLKNEISENIVYGWWHPMDEALPDEIPF